MCSIQECENGLEVMKSLLQKVWPQLLVKRINYNVSIGSTHLIEVNPMEGLTVKILSKNVLNSNFITVEEIQALRIDTLYKVCLELHTQNCV